MAEAAHKKEMTEADDKAKAGAKVDKLAKRRTELLQDASKTSTQFLKDVYFRKELEMVADCTIEEIEEELNRRGWK